MDGGEEGDQELLTWIHQGPIMTDQSNCLLWWDNWLCRYEENCKRDIPWLYQSFWYCLPQYSCQQIKEVLLGWMDYKVDRMLARLSGPMSRDQQLSSSRGWSGGQFFFNDQLFGWWDSLHTQQVQRSHKDRGSRYAEEHWLNPE